MLRAATESSARRTSVVAVEDVTAVLTDRSAWLASGVSPTLESAHADARTKTMEITRNQCFGLGSQLGRSFMYYSSPAPP